MKKILSLLLTMLYLVCSVGVANSATFCQAMNSKVAVMDNGLSSTNTANAKPTCTKCAKCNGACQKGGKCCQNQTKLLKLQIDQSLAKDNHTLSMEQFVVLQHVLPILGIFFEYPIEEHKPTSYSSDIPPSSTPINILNCVYRI